MIILLLTLFSETTWAKTYYISSTEGNDNYSDSEAQKPSKPWRTFEKLAIVLARSEPNTTILFKRGDLFFGALKIQACKNLILGAYGTGEKPIITGLQSIDSWIKAKNNIWYSNLRGTLQPELNILLAAGKNVPMGRFPNTGYIPFQSTSGNNILISSALAAQPTNWTGADIVIKKQRWTLERGKILNQKNNSLSYRDRGIYSPQNGYGFFIQNDLRTLDKAGEWFYDFKAKRVYIYSSIAPSRVQIPMYGNLLEFNDISNLTISDIQLSGSNSNAIDIRTSENITISDCDIVNAGIDGIAGGEVKKLSINRCRILNTNDNGIKLTTTCSEVSISGNIIENTGLIPGATQTHSYGAIASPGPNSIIKNNNVRNTGYCGIVIQGKNSLVINNIIENSCLIKDDGGGIYAPAGGSGRIISGNIILNSKGTKEGTNNITDILAHGIYIDEKGSDILIEGNTVAGCSGAGIFIHEAAKIRIENNTLYNNGIRNNFLKGAFMAQQGNGGRAIRKLKINDNIFFAKEEYQLCLFLFSTKNDIGRFAKADNNYYSRASGVHSYINTYSSSSDKWPGKFYDLRAWQAETRQDKKSSSFNQPLSESDSIRFEYNASSEVKDISLDRTYVDVKRNRYTNSVRLKPFKSIILIPD